MRHAYLIMAHNNFSQLKILLSLLDDERNDIYLHIDAKVDRGVIPDLTDVVHKSTLQFVTPIPVVWGDYSQVACEMKLIQAAVSSGEYGYLHLISCIDMPLKSNDEIARFFEKHNGKEFIAFAYTAMNDGHSDDIKNRIALYHPWQKQFGKSDPFAKKAVGKIQKIIGVNRLRSDPFKVIGKGSNWVSITPDFANYLIAHADLVHKVFRSSLCADELFMQTMILNSPFAGNLYHPVSADDNGDNLRLIDWNRGTPYVFRSADYEELKNTPALFARKFDENIDDRIIKRLQNDLTHENA